MKGTIFVGLILAVSILLAHGLPVEVEPTPAEQPDPQVPEDHDNEIHPAPEPEPEHETEEYPEYTPQQIGRLSRFNGNFFQLYGFTEQHGANTEAFAGNFLNSKGNLLEFLGNEHSLRQVENFFKNVQEERYENGRASSGREAEILKSQGDIAGEISSLIGSNAGLEREQAVLEFTQMKDIAQQAQLEIQQGRLEAKQALTELDQGELEENQIKSEKNIHATILKYVELENELEQLKEGNEKPAAVAEASE